MRTNSDLSSNRAKVGKPRKPRVFTTENYEIDRFKLYVDLVVSAFCELLGIERRELAVAARMSKEYLTSILRNKPLTRESIASLDAALRAIARQRIKQAKVDSNAPIPQQLLDAQMLISIGLERRARILMSMTRSKPVDAVSRYEDQEQYLVALLVNGDYLKNRATDREVILPLVRQAFPHLPNRELGFAYSAVAKAILNAKERDFETSRYTASLFELAGQHYGASMAWSVSMLITSIISTIRRTECSTEERNALLSRLNVLLNEVDIFAVRLPITQTQVAHNLKLLAETLEFTAKEEGKTDDATVAIWRAQFQRAAKLYDIEIGRLGTESGSSLERGDLLLNAGYCKMKAVGAGIPELKKALSQFADCNSATHIAYTFKILSMAHLADANADTAFLCARCSVKIYKSIGSRVAKADIHHAELQLQTIEESNILTNESKRPLKSNDPIQLAMLYLKQNSVSKGQ